MNNMNNALKNLDAKAGYATVANAEKVVNKLLAKLPKEYSELRFAMIATEFGRIMPTVIAVTTEEKSMGIDIVHASNYKIAVIG